MFKRECAKISCYGEYGVGQSTLYVLKHTNARILAVDTSEKWMRRTQAADPDRSRLEIAWIDLGAIKRFGYPVSYEKRADFPHYARSLWERDVRPQLVLIDGRFRVFCFLYCLLQADPGTRIIFDDYYDRRCYHVVEELIRPVEACGRQALFIVPAARDRAAIEALMHEFRAVME